MILTLTNLSKIKINGNGKGQCQEQYQEQDQEKVQYLLEPPASRQVEPPEGPGFLDVQVEGLLQSPVFHVHMGLCVGPGVDEPDTKHRDVLVNVRGLRNRKSKKKENLRRKKFKKIICV
jgi:hypothetical protein